MSDPMSGCANTNPFRPNDFARTRCLEKHGQVSVGINPPIFMFLLYGRRIMYLGATGVRVDTHSFHPHSNASLNRQKTLPPVSVHAMFV